jgi:hypothetical protein
MGNYHVQFGKGGYNLANKKLWLLVHIRLELAGPGVQYIADNQLYNSIITAHAILMIFFMVNKLQMLNSFLGNVSYPSYRGSDKVKNYHSVVKIGNDNDPKDPLNKTTTCALPLLPGVGQGKKHNYTKVIIEDPYNNRDIIARVAKKQKGVYV